MESKKLEALMMSVDLGSFTRAAEVLGYTQSGLTHMMNSLEKEIGVPLLERGRSGVRLTPEGERVAPAIRDFLDSASRLDAALTQAGDVRREAIRVGTYASMGVHWLPGIIRRFREECPEASVEMRVTNHIAEAYAALLQARGLPVDLPLAGPHVRRPSAGGPPPGPLPPGGFPGPGLHHALPGL